GGESGSEASMDQQFFNHPGVAIFASSGDSGFGASYPATGANVIAVGGTTLATSSSARGWVEKAWSGAGAGCSSSVAKPSWQTDHADGQGCSMRMESDVSAVADPNTGVAVFDGGWQVVGGTSAASPLVAGIYVLTGHNADNGSFAWQNPTDFFDVTTG